MSTLLASAASIDLGPVPNLRMSGFAARADKSTGGHDPLLATALLLENDGIRICIISCDLVGMSVSFGTRLRKYISESLSITAASVSLCCTHTHSGPTTTVFDWWNDVQDDTHKEWLVQMEGCLLQVTGGLESSLSPAMATWGEAALQGIGYNRQNYPSMEDGQGVIDEALTVLAIDSERGDPIATLINYATHPVVLGAWNLEYSGDYPGAACREITRRRGGVTLFLQGACGDIDPVIYQDRGWGMGNYTDTERIGAQIADTAMALIRDGKPITSQLISAHCDTLLLNLEPPPSKAELARYTSEMEQIQTQAASLGTHPVQLLTSRVMLKWAGKIEEGLAKGTVPKSQVVEVQLLCIGPISLVCLPLELYSEIGLRIKRESAAFSTHALIVGYANGDLGYCPTDAAMVEGGYGPSQAYRWHPESFTPFSPGAADTISAAVAALLARAAGQPPMQRS